MSVPPIRLDVVDDVFWPRFSDHTRSLHRNVVQLNQASRDRARGAAAINAFKMGGASNVSAVNT